jgi:hypothetical protein
VKRPNDAANVCNSYHSLGFKPLRTISFAPLKRPSLVANSRISADILLVKEDEKKSNSVFAQSLALDERIVFLLRSQVEYYKIFIYSPFSLISY